jgi:hypothetical protein
MAEDQVESRPLDDVMLAMDVVDTLRHQQLLVERELNTEERDTRMMERLRTIYASQGIDVPEHVLEEGVSALKEDRFLYDPPEPAFNTWLARVYVSRGRWAKPLGLTIGVLLVVWLGYGYFVKWPAEREAAELPSRLQSQYQVLSDQAKGPVARDRSRALLENGNYAMQKDDLPAVRDVIEKMESLQSEIEREYELRIVSRPGERSGVWRIPDANTNARNYYIIVEAVTPEGAPLEIPIVNEEDGKTSRTSKWGLRVPEAVFERIAADKKDDGIIQDKLFGKKRRGFIEPEYSKSTTGSTITSW